VYFRITQVVPQVKIADPEIVVQDLEVEGEGEGEGENPEVEEQVEVEVEVQDLKDIYLNSLVFI
jgi:hypothetical protein